MPIQSESHYKFTCPHCGKIETFKINHAPQKVICSNCNTQIDVEFVKILTNK